MLKSQRIEYNDDDVVLEAYYAFDDTSNEKRPAVLVAHDWTGMSERTCRKVDQLAELGYVGVAINMFGKGVLGNTNDEKSGLIKPFLDDRKKLQKRMMAGLNAAKKLPEVDAARIGAIGFCFGGLCVLDLARSGADVKGVVSFHGLLQAPANMPNQPIKAKVLVLDGFDDPMVPHELIIAFGEEMTESKADWQLTMYGNTMHAFTNQEANDPGFGTVYHKSADARSWVAMREFFREIF
jgi:dienelactone hydrolase